MASLIADIVAGRAQALGFSLDDMPPGVHVCLIHDDREEQTATIRAFLGGGIARGQGVSYLASERSTAELDTDIAVCCDRHRAVWDGVRCRRHDMRGAYGEDRGFTAAGGLSFLRDETERLLAGGAGAARIMGEPTWATQAGARSLASLLGVERGIEGLVRDFPLSVVCQYNARRLHGGVLLDVLRLHPVVAIGGMLYANPYFVGGTVPAEALRPDLH